MTYITVGSPSALILDFLEEWGMERVEEITADVIPYATKIFVNGCWVGLHRDPEDLVSTLKSLRRNVNLPVEVGVVWDLRDRELRLYSDAGRCCRPLFIVENQKLKITREHITKLTTRSEDGEKYGWTNLMAEGLVEFIDTSEEESVMIAMSMEDLEEATEYSYTYTHCKSISYTTLFCDCNSIQYLLAFFFVGARSFDCEILLFLFLQFFCLFFF
jgi:DNA-directed RNA polymerase II subunit RPB2